MSIELPQPYFFFEAQEVKHIALIKSVAANKVILRLFIILL
jgi:hypothetical protein